MKIILNNIPTSSGSSSLKVSWYYALRVGPAFDTDIAGEETSGAYQFEIDTEKDYKLYDGKNAGAAVENESFGIKKGSMLALQSIFIPEAKLEEKEKILTDVIQNENTKYPVPHELVISGDMNSIPGIDMNEVPYTFKY